MTVLKKSTLRAAGAAFILMAVMFSGCPVSYTPNVNLNNDPPIVVKPTPPAGPILPTGIHFIGDPEIIVFTAGLTEATLTAEVLPTEATIRTVYWSSDNPQIAQFRAIDDGTGVPKAKITPVAKGTTRVRATVQDGKGGEYTVTCTVQVDMVPDKGIRIGGPGLDTYGRLIFAAIGEEKYIDATVLLSSNLGVTWSLNPSANPLIELASQPWSPLPTSTSGQLVMVKALRDGQAELTATSADGLVDTIFVRVGVAHVEKIDIVTLNGNSVKSLTIPVSRNPSDIGKPVTAMLTPANTGFDEVTWEIDSGAAGINVVTFFNGSTTYTTTQPQEAVFLTALTAGTAVLKATAADGTFTTCAIRVPLTINPVGLILILDDAKLKEQKLTASTTPNVTWTIDPPGIANISKNTLTGELTVTAISGQQGGGQATITATTAWRDGDGNPLTAVCPVTVLDTFLGTTHILNVPIKRPGSAPVTPEPTGPLTITASSSTIEWTNTNNDVADWPGSDPDIPTKGASVTLTARDMGNTFVTATNADGSLNRRYRVTVPLRFEYPTRTIEKGDIEQLYTTLNYDLTYAPATEHPERWQTSNPTVATVDGWGRVTALSAGTAIIKATYNGVEADCVVTVPLTINPATLILYLDSPNLYDRRTLISTIDGNQAEWTTDNAVPFEPFTSSGNGDGTLMLIGKYAGEATITVTTTYDGTTGVPITLSSPGTPVTAQCVVRVEEQLGQVVTLNAPINYQGTTPSSPQQTPAPTYRDLPALPGQPGAVSVPPGSTWHIDGTGVAELSIVGDSTPRDTIIGQAVTVTAIGAGTTSLTVTDTNNNLVTRYLINVPLRLERSSIVLNLGNRETLYTTMGTAGMSNINWTSDATTIVTVDTNGTVHGVAPGKTRVRAEYPIGSGLFFDCDVSVRLVTSIPSLYIDEIRDVPGIAGMWLPPYPATVWTVDSGSAYVTVDQAGKVTGIDATPTATEAKVAARVNGNELISCTVEVRKRTLTLNNGGVPSSIITTSENQSAVLTVTFDPPYSSTAAHPTHLTEPTLNWTSSDGTKASVSGVSPVSLGNQAGRVTGVSMTPPGQSVFVTADAGRGQTVSCEVIVAAAVVYELKIYATKFGDNTTPTDPPDWNGKTYFLPYSDPPSTNMKFPDNFTLALGTAGTLPLSHVVYEFDQPEGSSPAAIHDMNKIVEIDTAGGISPGVPVPYGVGTMKIKAGYKKGTVRINVYNADSSGVKGEVKAFIVIAVGDKPEVNVSEVKEVELFFNGYSGPSISDWRLQDPSLAQLVSVNWSKIAGEENLLKAKLTVKGFKKGETTLVVGMYPTAGDLTPAYTVSYPLTVTANTTWYVSSNGKTANSGLNPTAPIRVDDLALKIHGWYNDPTLNAQWPGYKLSTEQPARILFMDTISTGLLNFGSGPEKYELDKIPTVGSEVIYTPSYNLTVPLGKSVTMKNITIKASISVNGAFTMAGGKITSSNNQAVLASNQGVFTMSGGSISAPIGVYVGNGGEVVMSGGTVEAVSQGVSVISLGRFLMSGGTVTATGDTGKGIQTSSPFITMNGGTVTATGANGIGVLQEMNSFTMNGGTVTATGANGIGVQSSSTFNMSGGTVMAKGSNSVGVLLKSVHAKLNMTISAKVYGVSSPSPNGRVVRYERTTVCHNGTSVTVDGIVMEYIQAPWNSLDLH